MLLARLFAVLGATLGLSVSAQVSVDCEQAARFVPTVPRGGAGDPCAASAGVVVEARSVLNLNGSGTSVRDVARWFNPTPVQFRSSCWEGMRSQMGFDQFLFSSPQNGLRPQDEFPRGFRGNLTLLTAAVPGTYFATSPTLGDSSECLLPPASAASPTGWQGESRQTIDQRVDLVTGLPLVKVTDLELPLGAATFRLTRTRSALHGHSFPAVGSEIAKWPPEATDRMWDWTGSGWMIGENPVLLIDDTRSDVVGEGAPTCWLVLDAHHSIPFQWVQGINRYEAPPRFRASLTYAQTVDSSGQIQTGVWGTGPNGRAQWLEPPLEYKVSLYDGALTYTFAAVYEDVPANRFDRGYLDPTQVGQVEATSYHDRPLIPDTFRRSVSGSYYTSPEAAVSAGVPGALLGHHPFDPRHNPGLGIPYMGLCTKVEDRFGHAVQIAYCRPTQKSMDSGRSADCVECQQGCLRKGQISHITLRDQGAIKWTLVYSHRQFAGVRFGRERDLPTELNDYFHGAGTYPLDPAYLTDPERYETHGQSAIDRVYVYEGDVLARGTPDELTAELCMTTPSAVPSLLAGIGETASVSEPVERYIGQHTLTGGAEARLRGWKYRVRYDYNQARALDPSLYESWVAQGQEMDPRNPLGPALIAPSSPALLVLTTVDRREGVTAAAVRADQRAYVYGGLYDESLTNGETTRPFQPYDHPFNQPGGIFGDVLNQAAHLRALPWLCAVLDSEDIGRLLGTPQGTAAAPTAPVTLHELAYQRKANSDVFVSAETRERIVGTAKVRFDPAAGTLSNDLLRWRVPSYSSLFESSGVYGQYIRVEREHCRYDGHWATVGEYTRREGTREKAYRFHRFICTPEGESAEADHGTFQSLKENFSRVHRSPPTQSVFLNPFYWHACQGVSEVEYAAAAAVVQPPVLTEPRFIVVADEFATRAAMMDRDLSYETTHPGARKVGLTARTVYEINAWGYVLKTRRWEYKEDSASVAMKGIGQEFIYKPVGEVVCTASDTWRTDACNCGVTLPTSVLPPPPNTCPPPAFLRELLLVEKYSVGWSAAENAAAHGGDTSGLVEFYEYRFNGNSALTQEEFPWSTRLQQVASGVKKGSEGTRHYTGQRFYDWSRPGRLVCDVRFNTPATALLSAPPAPPTGSTDPDPAYAATFYTQAYYDDDASVPLYARPVASTLMISPPLRQRPGGPLYYPVQRELYTREGLAHWQITGLVKSPQAPVDDGDPLQRLLFTYTRHGRYGAVDYSVADAVPGVNAADPSYPGNYELVPALEAGPGWARIAPTPALAYTTKNWYDFKGNLTDTFRPGRRWSVRYVVHDPDPLVDGDETVEEFTFDNLVTADPATGDVGPFTTQSPGVRRLLKGRDRGGAVIDKQTVYYPGPVTLLMTGQSGSTPSTGLPVWEPIKKFVYRLDSFGRPQGAEVVERMTGPTGQLLWLPAGGKEINDLGEVYRQWDYGGNITRWTRNHLGQRLRKYVGSIDSEWGNPGRDPNNTQGGANEFGSRYDMVLKERTEFGTSPSDVWQPTVERRYVRDPQWAHVDYYGAGPSGDADAYVSRHNYDWRGRRVRTDEHDLGDPFATSSPSARVRTTLRYLDYAGREALTVEFGPLMPAVLPASLDPALSEPAAAVPAADAFFALSPRPVSVTERCFDAGDRVIEERSYDVSAPLAPALPYTAKRSLYGQGGQEVFTQSEDGRSEVVTLDAIGRVARKAVVAYGRSSNPLGYELSRTDYTMDVEGRVLEEVTWERVRPLADALDSSNAVASTRWMWYDTQGRRTGEANLGTGRVGASGWTEFRAASPGEAALERPGAGPTLDPTSLLLDRAGLPAWAQVTASAYDRANHLVAGMAADGTVTTYTYQGDKVKAQTENARAGVSDQRATMNTYANGRLVNKHVGGVIGERGAAYDNEKSDAACQYGAAVMDSEFVVRSFDRAQVGAMGRVGGSVSPFTGSWEFIYSYNFSGQLAQRLAGDGTVTRYRYDALGRLASIEVGHTTTGTDFVVGYPASTESEVAADRIGYVEFSSSWAAAGGVPLETRDIIARIGKIDPAHPTQPGRVISHVRQKFDGRGKLVREWQSAGALVTAGSPSIEYQWTYECASPAGSAGRLRLASMVYPVVDGGERRAVTLGYGAAGSLDDDLCRVASLTTSVPGSGTAVVSSYGYTGADRRASTTLGVSGVVQTLDGSPSAVGLTGLDGFGRVRDLTFRNGGGAGGVLFGSEYDYDLAGRMTAAKVTHVPVASAAQVNTRSSVYGYDALGRLTAQDLGAVQGTWGGAAGSWGVAASGKLRSDRWWLDVLDNWSVSAAGSPLQDAGGRVSTGNLDWYGTPFAYPGAGSGADSLVSRYATTDRSDLETVRRSANGSTPAEAVMLRDGLGRITCDGLFWYHYDAWGRLVQVNLAKYSAEGGENGGPAWSSSTVIRHMVYDGLGRLIRVQAPVVAPVLDPEVTPVELLGEMRSQLLYYDGVRRILEVVVDPVDPKAVALLSEDLAERAKAEETKGESTPGEGAGGKTANVSYEKEVQAPTRIGREYIWGPGDGYAGVDELVCQFDGIERARPWWTVQDLTGDIVALIDKPASSAAVVVWQCTYEPYGGVLAEATLALHPRVHLGHKGLFVDNLDTVAFTALEPDVQPVLAAGRPLLYHVRNRSMLAGEPVDEGGEARVWAGGMGRFLQADPNATGLGVLALPLRHGAAVSLMPPQPNLAMWTADGCAALAYCAQSPLNQRDPLGLLIGPTTTFDLWTDHAQNVLEWGTDIRGFVENMFGDYGTCSVMDTEWALDMRADDHEYSASATYSEYYDYGNRFNRTSTNDGPAQASAVRKSSSLATMLQWHHVISNKGKRAAQRLTSFAGMAQVDPAKLRALVNSTANQMGLAVEVHNGRHAKAYHGWVWEKIWAAVGTKKGDAALQAVQQAITDMMPLIRANPGVLKGICP